MMVEGTRLMSNPEEHDKALKVFEAMIKAAPTFPEAYNKRATLMYVMRRFEDSIQDCRTVLAMQPHHFGAASGMGLC
ncbi:TPR_REGION domain-containing protein [Haematococcus lacustris]|uniref:TPR_REGION domain-containing protein n=1 Tax=Haematococcus lacustris TaxID=44745 RepID=A0A699ZVD6_HAELA|nr:TPR_REGION domain-containing protein [Haematococcus lacustris]